MDFEIKFYEGILKDMPNFIQALTALADTYTKRGLFEKGLCLDKRLTSLRPDDPIARYNLACSYSLLNDIESGLNTLQQAVMLGYDDFDFMEKDPDLENLRKDERFKNLTSKLKTKK